MDVELNAAAPSCAPAARAQKSIANPEYKMDDSIYHVCNPCSAVGFELWQVKAGSVFQDIIVTDSAAEAAAFAAETFDKKSKAEKAADEKKKAEEEAARKKAEEEAKAKAEAEKKDEEKEEKEEDDDEEL